jgi:hypothetical protein
LLNGQPFKKIIAVEAVWFQLGGAGVLWWEANATLQRLGTVIFEARRAPPHPTTLAEKIVWLLVRSINFLVCATAYLLVAAGLLGK